MIQGACHCGSVSWSYEGPLESVTACNCTVCRRYGVLWAYGYENETIRASGPTSVYMRGQKHIGFHFCPTCGCVSYWRATVINKEGKRRIAVNVRLINDPELIQNLPIDHFDGLDKFDDLPRDERCVKDMWF